MMPSPLWLAALMTSGPFLENRLYPFHDVAPADRGAPVSSARRRRMRLLPNKRQEMSPLIVKECRRR